MQLNRKRVRRHLETFDFEPLFIEEMGWDRQRGSLPVLVEDEMFTLEAIAQKRGMVAYACHHEPFPAYRLRRKIETQVARSVHEHVIIHTNAEQTTQVWQWVKREPGKPAASREHRYDAGQPGNSLIQKLEGIAFSLEEEEGLTIVDVTSRVRAAFDVEQITRRFYDRFKAEQTAFHEFLQGIPNAEMQSWYVSVMLNRLMFIYFIQKKGFLDSDLDYLRRKLAESQRRGPDQFYRAFLCPLFFEGFARRPGQRSPEVRRMLGQVPFLNGGLFLRHEIERQHGERIRIPDAAFERLFEFFERYQWHLDDRPLRTDNEINPDVLGYIFEKYVNQKEMGAYYTKEDITDYIGKYTIIPFLLDRVRDDCPAAFTGTDAIWKLLREDPDRYIYPAVRHGADADPELPPEIAAGLDDISQRGAWNTPAREEYGLPTEIWREVVARRRHYQEVHDRLAAGEVRDVNELITLNLDIRQFAQDVIADCDDPAFLRAFWRAVNEVSVLDPTVGSGAFLFAALNILEPLYEGCLERMESFLEEAPPGSRKYPDFRHVLERVAQHPNERYFIFKSIIINNLYGVDIMDEAVEIAKLRLFLKLVAEVESVDRIEPLPDIDFNIRAGNTLVGFATYDEVERAVRQEGDQFKMMGLFEDPMQAIEQKAQDVDRLYQHFRRQQTELGGEVTPQDKQALRERLDSLDDELDRYLGKEYGVNADLPMDLEQWRESHKPFHWFVEFYGILKQGGFDVIIGNPPYVELRVMKDYGLIGYVCEKAGNLYALVIERCLNLCSPAGRQGFSVPVSSVSTSRYESLQRLLTGYQHHHSSYDDRPSRLFDGLEHARLTIHLIGQHCGRQHPSSTRYNKWLAAERPTLFEGLRYTNPQTSLVAKSLPKMSVELEREIMQKLAARKRRLGLFYTGGSEHKVFYSRKVGYFLQVLDFIPRVLDGKGRQRAPTEFKELCFSSELHAKAALCCLNSNLFYWFVTVASDCRHVNKREVNNFPVELDRLVKEQGTVLAHLAEKLMADLKASSEDRTMRFQHDTLTVQAIMPKFSKSIIDEIDLALAQHYGLTGEELDFVTNYDIKYRMGEELFEDDEDGTDKDED